jgi:hypothetical protein
VEKFSDALGLCSGIMAKVHGKNNGGSNDHHQQAGSDKAVRIDSQAKYGIVARGDAK